MRVTVCDTPGPSEPLDGLMVTASNAAKAVQRSVPAPVFFRVIGR